MDQTDLQLATLIGPVFCKINFSSHSKNTQQQKYLFFWILIRNDML